MLAPEMPPFASSSRGDPYPSGGKRRLPMGGASSSNPKSRRREDAPSRRTAGISSWQQPEIREYAGGRAQREELVDQQIVDKIRAGGCNFWAPKVL